jgi:hypothetical protein
MSSVVETRLRVGASISFPAGDMDGSPRMGRPAVAGTHWHPGLAGHCASALDLYRAHGSPPARPAAKTAAGGTRARVAIMTGFAVLSYFVLVCQPVRQLEIVASKIL